ncbi:hypothetical protein DXA13_00860 [Clostridium sp. AM58-1XD]|nr:hypothetical protein DXA13_00860 [Clostridium sp. AM58-1XD]
MDIISQVINMIESFFSELVESFAILIKILKIVAFFAGGPSTFDMQYIVNIESGAAGQLPSRTGMFGSESPHMEGDLNTVRDELDKTREVADQIGYDLNEMPVSENYDNGNSQLEREMNNISYRLQRLLESCNKLMNPSIFDLLSMGLTQLATIISIIVDVVSMLGSLLAVAIMFQGELTKYIMRGVLLNTYIVGKFSDRTNAGSFAKYSSYRAPSETVTGLDETMGWLNRDVIEFKTFGYGKGYRFSGQKRNTYSAATCRKCRTRRRHSSRFCLSGFSAIVCPWRLTRPLMVLWRHQDRFSQLYISYGWLQNVWWICSF